MLSNYNLFILESKIYQLILEKNLNCSSVFLEKMRQISHKSPIAQVIYLAFSSNLNIDRNLNQNYIDVTDTDSMVSFLSDAKMDAGQTSSRSQIGIGRFARYIIPFISTQSFTDKDFETFVNLYKASFVTVKERFELVSGEIIKKYYLVDNYAFDERGQLGNSCMRYEQCQDFFKIYTKNPDSCQMLVYLDENNKVLGRALVWKLSKSPCAATHLLDRIYTARDSDIDRFKAYAQEKGWLTKWKNDSDDTNNIVFMYNGEMVIGRVESELSKVKYDEYPFMDTMSYIDPKGKKVTNVNGKKFIAATDTDGSSQEDCWDCDGDGKVTGTCNTCNGNGEIECPECSGNAEVKCPKCHGDGTNGPDIDCPDCKGTGRVKKLVRMGKCLKCNGTGKTPSICDECDGTGDVLCKNCEGNGYVECPSCKGSGEVEDEPCPNCVANYQQLLEEWINASKRHPGFSKIGRLAEVELQKLKDEKPEKAEKKKKKSKD